MKHIKRLALPIAAIVIYIIYSAAVGGFKFGNKYALIFNKDNPDTFLSHKHYKYSCYTSDTTIYFIALKGNFAEITNYEVKNNEQINISLKPEDKLIISFPNRGTPWRYIIDNLNDIDILRFRYCTMIHTVKYFNRWKHI